VTVATALDECEADIKTRAGGVGNVSQLRHNTFDFPGRSTSRSRRPD
jgi:hypothetical protein